MRLSGKLKIHILLYFCILCKTVFQSLLYVSGKKKSPTYQLDASVLDKGMLMVSKFQNRLLFEMTVSGHLSIA